MTKVELVVQQDCKLCTDAKKILKRLRNEVPFELLQTQLTEDHPKYKVYLVSVPVVLINGTKELAGNISEPALREALGMVYALTPFLSIAKFLEALGFLTVFVGLFNGLRGDMWTDLYFFLAGIAMFVFGRTLEKREMKRQQFNSMHGSRA
jgi:glutaredoxin